MLIPILQTVGVLLIALFGAYLGSKFAKFRRFWALGYIIALLIIAAFVAVLYLPQIFGSKFTFMVMMGRMRFVLLCFAVAIGLSNTISRLPKRFERYAIFCLMVMVVSWFCLLPFAVPAALAKDYQKIRTYFDSSGVCLQSLSYTCGPASAVTALHRLGVMADEGDLTIRAHTTPITGTLPGCLVDAINDSHGKDGIFSEFRFLNSVEELKNHAMALVILKDRLMLNHCAAVIKITDKKVVLADPSLGMVTMPLDKFEKQWRKAAILINKKV